MRGNILVIDDEDWVYESVKDGLPGHNVYHVDSLPKVRGKIFGYDIDLVLVDLNIKKDGEDREDAGMEFIKTIHQRYPTVSIIVLSSFRNIDKIVRATQLGANRYLYKGHLELDSDEFREDLRQLVNEKKERDKLRIDLLKNAWDEPELGTDTLTLVKNLAESEESFFLEGEEGLGKTDLIRHLLAYSPRISKHKKIIAVNLEWFSHQQVLAFMSDKNEQKEINFFVQAHNGILQLHNFDYLPIYVQSQFIRLLRRRKFLNSSDPLDLQIIFCVSESTESLMFRQKLSPEVLAALPCIKLPPLRNRKEDIPHLVSTFINRLKLENLNISQQLLDSLQAYSYPGNISELYGTLKKIIHHHQETFPGNWEKKTITGQSLPQL
ncbi:MAG: response regulator, partial [Bacteroidetes bacterium]|nr:response regulator [Bacteroidota bacterium]